MSHIPMQNGMPVFPATPRQGLGCWGCFLAGFFLLLGTLGLMMAGAGLAGGFGP